MGIGGSFGGSSSSSSSTSTTESWLLDIMRPIIEGAVGNAGNMPEYGFAGLNQGQLEALQGIMGGSDQSGIQQGNQMLGNLGVGAMWKGGNYLKEAMGDYQSLMNSLQGGGYQKAIDAAYNSDLVGKQTAQLQDTLAQQLAGQVQGINQAAGGSGGMGSSRAGVAEGVAIGETQQALAQGTLNLQQQAYNNAISQTNASLGMQMSGLQNQMTQGSNLVGMGQNAMNQSLGWLQQMNQTTSNDLFNKYMAGSILQQNQQGQMDTDRLNQIIKDNPALGQLQLLLPVIGGTAGWGSTTTGSGSSSGSNWGVSGGLGNWGGSDARLKSNLEVLQEGQVHQLESGETYYIPRIYKWEWNETALKLFEEQGILEYPETVGVIAQELEMIGLDALVKVNETCVRELEGYVRLVNYEGLVAFIASVFDLIAKDGEA